VPFPFPVLEYLFALPARHTDRLNYATLFLTEAFLGEFCAAVGTIFQCGCALLTEKLLLAGATFARLLDQKPTHHAHEAIVDAPLLHIKSLLVRAHV
jgi:hypothetical protein